MKKLVIELCCVIVLAACGNGKERRGLYGQGSASRRLDR